MGRSFKGWTAPARQYPNWASHKDNTHQFKSVGGLVFCRKCGGTTTGAGDTKGKLTLADSLELEGAILGSESIRGIDIEVATDSAELTIEFPESKASPDYAVSVTPNWPAFTWVTDKTIDDFTINFSQNSPFDGTIDWIIIE